MPSTPTKQQIVDRCQTIMSHAWMVRTFVKHCEEVEDFPQLMTMPRAIFDTARALETRLDNPDAYLHMLRKKIDKLRNAAAQFRDDAHEASQHTNFKQAVLSIEACISEFEQLLEQATV